MILCETCNENPNSHSFKLLKSSEKRLIFYTSPSEAENYFDNEGILSHIDSHLNHYLDNKTWIWIIDLKNFGLYHSLNVSLPIQIIQLLREKKYIDKLIKIRLKNITTYANVLINSTWLLLSDDVRSKIVY